MDRYTYHIHPHKTITNIIPGKGIRRPMGLKLTKEEVLKCLACGPVYRAFPEGSPIRVTGSNLDSLHVSWEEWLNKDNKEEKVSNTTETTIETPISNVEIPIDIKSDASTEEKANEIEEKKEKIEDLIEKSDEIEQSIIEKDVADPNVIERTGGISITDEISIGSPITEEKIDNEEITEFDSDEEDESEDDTEEEDESVVQIIPGQQLIPQQAQYPKKKKKRH